VRARIGHVSVESIPPGEWRTIDLDAI